MGLSIFSTYQALARFVRDRCDSQQELGSSQLDERWLVDRIQEFLAKKFTKEEFGFDTFAPGEFKTGKPGGVSTIDLAGSRRHQQQDIVSKLIEVKLMLEGNRKWGKEILADIFRVGCVRKYTTTHTHRLVVVVGQDRRWRLEDQYGALLKRLCPMDRRRNPLYLGLQNHSKSTRLTDKWRAANLSLIEEYLHPHLPEQIRVELVGLSKSQRDVDENPDHGMIARLWRVYPGKYPDNVSPGA